MSFFIGPAKCKCCGMIFNNGTNENDAKLCEMSAEMNQRIETSIRAGMILYNSNFSQKQKEFFPILRIIDNRKTNHDNHSNQAQELIACKDIFQFQHAETGKFFKVLSEKNVNFVLEAEILSLAQAVEKNWRIISKKRASWEELTGQYLPSMQTEYLEIIEKSLPRFSKEELFSPAQLAIYTWTYKIGRLVDCINNGTNKQEFIKTIVKEVHAYPKIMPYYDIQ